MLKTIGCGIDVLDRKEMVGKKLWIVIRHKVKLENGKEMSREADMFDFSAEDKRPNVANLIEEYESENNDNEFPEI
jgi:hypothetical protein